MSRPERRTGTAYGGKDIVDELIEAVVEGRRADALDMIGELFPGENMRSIDTWHRMFPDRVAVRTEKDRAH